MIYKENHFHIKAEKFHLKVVIFQLKESYVENFTFKFFDKITQKWKSTRNRNSSKNRDVWRQNFEHRDRLVLACLGS